MTTTDPVDRAERVAASESGAAPLSSGQERLLWLYELDPDSAAYHLPLALELPGPPDRAALERALDGLVARHGVLAARYGRDAAGDAYQVPVPGFRIPVLGPGDGESGPADAVATPFDLFAAPNILQLTGNRQDMLVIK